MRPRPYTIYSDFSLKDRCFETEHFVLWFSVKGRAFLDTEGALSLDLELSDFEVLFETPLSLLVSDTLKHSVSDSETGPLRPLFEGLIVEATKREVSALHEAGRLDFVTEEDEVDHE